MKSNKTLLGLQLIMTIGFMIVFLGVSGLGFVLMPGSRYIDIIIVPVLIGSMIGISSLGSHIPAIVFGTLWGAVALTLSNGAFVCEGHTIIHIISSRVLTALLVTRAYYYLRLKMPKSLYCPFMAIGITILVRFVLAIVFGLYFLDLQFTCVGVFAFKSLAELTLNFIVLKSGITKLRQLHLLNGVKH